MSRTQSRYCTYAFNFGIENKKSGRVSISLSAQFNLAKLCVNTQQLLTKRLTACIQFEVRKASDGIRQ